MKRMRLACRRPSLYLWGMLAMTAVMLSGCAPEPAASSITETAPTVATRVSSTSTATSLPDTPTPQPTATSARYGPDPGDFPAGINPLTGQPADPALLRVPALLVSISHFPATARPQSGLSFAPYVFEYSITEGQTRFLTTFYGQYPSPEIPITGDCAVRQGVFSQSGTLLGNRVWLDTNQDGIQELSEPGIGGICVNLYDAGGELIDKTTTDSNGYYGFNVKADLTYSVEFVKPAYLDFTKPNIGDESHDSDADPQSGRAMANPVRADDLQVDAGLIPSSTYAAATPDPNHDPKAQVGPVRSGRLLYAYIGGFFQDSCLIYAFASSEVLPQIPHCAFVTHEVYGGGYMLDIEHMKAIAQENMRKTANRPFNYTSNVFADDPPAGGSPATQINVYFASLNQSGWSYDPLYQAYLRYVDTADKHAPGVLHPEIDRLTGRQLHFENVIVVMADTEVVTPTNLNIHIEQGGTGYAYLFRDGRTYPIRWSTRSGAYEQESGFRRPIQFVNADGSPAALKPGHTWVIIVTPFSTMRETQPGVWFVAYAAPEGEAR